MPVFIEKHFVSFREWLINRNRIVSYVHLRRATEFGFLSIFFVIICALLFKIMDDPLMPYANFMLAMFFGILATLCVVWAIAPPLRSWPGNLFNEKNIDRLLSKIKTKFTENQLVLLYYRTDAKHEFEKIYAVFSYVDKNNQDLAIKLYSMRIRKEQVHQK